MNNFNKYYLKENKAIIFVMVLFFLIPFISFSQITLYGRVAEEQSDEPISNVSILIKNAKESYLINFTSSDENGNYHIEFSKDADTLLIESSIISHLPVKKILIISKDKKSYNLNFSLHQRLTELDEILIEGKKRPINVKKDTTIYNINQFKDGTERVVEDLLKKLPGISIGDNGEIKFKGKQVVKVLLDNDNIFDSNYTIGTRNISSEIIEEIQAIEDYNSNPLLKGVKSSEDVAINLVLKDGMTDVSGNAEVGAGLKDKLLAKVNTIVVSKRLKGFSTLSYNNIGENYSPHNFATNSLDLSKINEYRQRTNNLVNSTGFNSTLPNNRISINDNFFNSNNALFRVNNKISLRANYNLFSDKLTRKEKHNTIYAFDDDVLEIVNSENITKKPLINTVEYELIYRINKKSLLTSIGKWDLQTIDKMAFGLNNNSVFDNATKSRDLLLKNDTEYSYKINEKEVLQFFSSISINTIPQNVNIRFEDQILDQEIKFKKNYFKLQSSYLSKVEQSEYELNLGYNFIEDFVDSNLNGLEVNNQNLMNDVYYKISNIYANFNFQYKWNKWRFITKLNNSLFQIKLNDINRFSVYDISFLSIRPTITINYSLNKISHFYLSGFMANQLPSANNIYSGLILTNSRSLRNNNFKFNLFNNNVSLLGFRINDFYSLFQFNASARYSYKKMGYINQFNIDENADFFTSIVDVTNNSNLDFNLDFEKYIHPLKTTINFNSSYTISRYQNIINDSELRNNTSKSLFGQLEMRTGFKSSLNFENKILFNNNEYSSNTNASNSFTSFQNDFSVKYLKNAFQLELESQYFKPDLSKNTRGDLFLDVLLNYKPSKSKLEYNITAKNLLNKKVYRNINTSDFSTSTFEHNLQERFILLSVQFKF